MATSSRKSRHRTELAADGRTGKIITAVYLGAALLMFSAEGADTNIPGCVTDITTILDLTVEIAQAIAYATDSCNPMWWTQPWVHTGIPPPAAFTGGNPIDRATGNPGWNQYGQDVDGGTAVALDTQDFCANDLLTVLADLTTILAKSESSALYCSGADNTGCPQQIAIVLAGIFGFAKDTTGAINDCQLSRWDCAGDILDVSSDLVTTVQNVQTGVDLCDTSPVSHNAPMPEPDSATAPKPGSPEPEPSAGAPQPEPNAGAPVPEPSAKLKASFFPGVTDDGFERRLDQEHVNLAGNVTTPKEEFWPAAQRLMYRNKFNDILYTLDKHNELARHRLQFASMFKNAGKKAAHASGNDDAAQHKVGLKTKGIASVSAKLSKPQGGGADVFV